MINKTQLVARTDKRSINRLVQLGYENPQNLPHNYTFSVFIVDLREKKIFGTNTTCMAAACSAGNKPIVLNFDELQERLTSDR